MEFFKSYLDWRIFIQHHIGWVGRQNNQALLYKEERLYENYNDWPKLKISRFNILHEKQYFIVYFVTFQAEVKVSYRRNFYVQYPMIYSTGIIFVDFILIFCAKNRYWKTFCQLLEYYAAKKLWQKGSIPWKPANHRKLVLTFSREKLG